MSYSSWSNLNVNFKQSGFIDYNDTYTDSNPITLIADTWTTVTNNGQGAFSNKLFPPESVTDLMDESTGQFDFSELSLGDDVFIRNDYTVIPTVNESTLELRYLIGSGAGAYTLEKTVSTLSRGSGRPYRFSLETDFIYMGDTNTRNFNITMQLNLSSNGTVTNAGSVIKVNRR